jgi:hypothetical protein
LLRIRISGGKNLGNDLFTEMTFREGIDVRQVERVKLLVRFDAKGTYNRIGFVNDKVITQEFYHSILVY